MRGLAQRRYLEEKIIRKRWTFFHDKEPWGFMNRERYYPEPGIYRKWNGSHGCHCVCGAVRKWYQKLTNQRIRNYKGEIPNGGAYKRFFDHWYIS